MSRIGNRKIEIPAGVTVEENEGVVTVKGPKGELSTKLAKGISIKVEENQLELTRVNDTKEIKSMHGTMNANLSNMIHGVTHEFQKGLEIIGEIDNKEQIDIEELEL